MNKRCCKRNKMREFGGGCQGNSKAPKVDLAIEELNVK